MNIPNAMDLSHHRNYPVLAVTMGDMNGIGPEVILKTLTLNPHPDAGILLFACREVLHFYAGLSNISPFWEDSGGFAAEGNDTFPKTTDSIPVPDAGQVILISPDTLSEKIQPGTVSAIAGKLSMQAVAASVAVCQCNLADAMITAPISKEAIHLAGFQVPGHTEYLAELTGTDHVGMMLANKTMRIGLATIHTPIKEVAGLLSSDRIRQQLQLHFHALTNFFGITDPRIAVLGLNPHAGDGGVLGNEEQEIIIPALDYLHRQGIRVDGPWPADGFFGSKSYEKYDLVFAMYHDQGLIPLKLSGFGDGINITVGLPIVRTSPDHGTAFSIAGKNRADPGSMKAATALAWTMALHRYN